jgi:50S ribosomal subunit-associated GTPase HflX
VKFPARRVSSEKFTGSGAATAALFVLPWSADGVLLVFDFSSPESFEEVAQLRDAINKKNVRIPMIVVANKSDLSQETRNTVIPATVIDDWECGYVECSARENSNISEVFKELLGKVKAEQGDGFLKLGSVSRHCFVRTQSSPAIPGFRRDKMERGHSKKGHKLKKRQTCTIPYLDSFNVE